MTTVAEPPELDLAELYRQHRLRLLRIAVLLVDDRASAEDVVQDAFAAVHRRGGLQLRNPDAALGYLQTSVVNAARSALRRRRVARKYLHHSLTADEPPADTELMLAAEHQEVLRALRRLPDRQREVLTLRYWSDLSEAQIAAALGISSGAVKSAASRGMHRLTELLGGTR
jgi:RNA polymerase sigma-70 factor (sigma-E family)